jgi:hypothetical protein
MAAKGKKDRFWEMRVAGGPYSDPSDVQQVFKCTGCGAETESERGWNGEPNRHRCHPGCPCQDVKVAQGNRSTFASNYDRIFPNAPGAGL